MISLMNSRTHALSVFSLMLGLSFFVSKYSLTAQTIVDKRTPQQVKASYLEHQGDFDYLLGDWEFTSENKESGKGRGFWSAIRLAEGAQILDEYRAVSPSGKTTYYASSTLRAYNAVLDRWDLVSADFGTGLQNIGTARRVGSEMHVEQKLRGIGQKPSRWRIRFYNIKSNSFSWTADRSLDGGKTWEHKHQQIEARRIGPSRSLGQLAPSRNPVGLRTRKSTIAGETLRDAP
jgi:hypothetical protein